METAIRWARGSRKAKRDAAMLQAYEEGLTLGQIAERFGLHKRTVSLIIRKLGAQTRTGQSGWTLESKERLRSIAALGSRARWGSARDPSVYVADLRAGLTRKQISEKYSITQQAVIDALVRAGIRAKRIARRRTGTLD